MKTKTLIPEGKPVFKRGGDGRTLNFVHVTKSKIKVVL